MAMVLLLEGIAQNHKACGAFTEPTQSSHKSAFVERRYWILLGLDTGPVDIGIWRLRRVQWW